MLNGYINVLNYLSTTMLDTKFNFYLSIGIPTANLETIEWIMKNNRISDVVISRIAIKSNRLDIIKWMNLNKREINPTITDLNIISRSGYIDILKIVYDSTKKLPNFTGANMAAEDNQLNVLDWLKTKGIFPTRDEAINIFKKENNILPYSDEEINKFEEVE